MKISSISDIHIRNEKDQRIDLLYSFLDNPKTLDSDYIILAGDIFDMMVGDYEETLIKYKDIFTRLADLSNEKRKIFWIEGNHDFHVREMIERFSRRLSKENVFQVIINGIRINDIYYCHGDAFKIDSKNYYYYRKFMRSSFLEHMAKNVFSYSLNTRIGEWASSRSRKRNEIYLKSEKLNEVRLKNRENVLSFISNDDLIERFVCGHTHAEDLIEGTFANNGFVPSSKKFVYFDNGVLSLQDLE